MPFLKNAIANAKAVDATPTHFMPNPKETKVYQLGEAILKQVPVNDFNHFVDVTIPQFIQAHLMKIQKAKARKK